MKIEIFEILYNNNELLFLVLSLRIATNTRFHFHLLVIINILYGWYAAQAAFAAQYAADEKPGQHPSLKKTYTNIFKNQHNS